ncbi:stealth conserved region 3 domain-containing protein [Pseudomonas sp. Irchel s3h17]|uniref:stealth conserved region 3 domain-containing protein n=1 Tax=Pseudomonas sp. Irchel s3h17 TaxID=2009182 RepID=UPI000BA4CC58|nr:stealth conserved region 3 domain-containing protein [Pseudomonas sp. Irchel s3h17]
MIILRELKKLKKLITNTDLFFYDLFRKRIEKKNSFSIESGVTEKREPDTIGFDREKLRSLGLLAFLKEALGGRSGVKDGSDPASLLIEQGQIEYTLKLVDAVRSAHPLRVNIYTLDGRYSFRLSHQALGLSRRLCKLLSTASDFVMELSDLDDCDCTVIHFFIGDALPSGGMVLRSGNVWIRKLPPSERGSICMSREVEPQAKPIDAVYTWVNSADPEWQSAWRQALPGKSFDADRYTNNDEFRYSLRSLGKYAPWLNRIYVVSNCAPPAWLSVEHPSIEWVRHENVFPDPSVLPTFNSHAIESCLHRIRGLSENFIYFNDDFFLGQPCLPGDFFDEYGRAIAYFEPYGLAYPDEISADTPDYIVATKNSSQLLHDTFQRRPRRPHKHVPYALKRSVLEELEGRFDEAFQTTRNSKLRSTTDINVASFLCQHYSCATGCAISADVKNFTAKPSNIKKLLNNGSVQYKFVCINDGGNSSSDLVYKELSQKFFLERYPERSTWEVTKQTLYLSSR